MNKKIKISLAVICILALGIIFIFNQLGNQLSDENEPIATEHPTESYAEIPSEIVEETQPIFENINYIRTLANTEILDLNGTPIGVFGENQTFTVVDVDDEGLIKLMEFPFYVNYGDIEIAYELELFTEIPLDLSRYLAFEQMIAEGETVDFYHLDHTFAFRLDATSTNIHIYMQIDDYFYVDYLDTYFLVAKNTVALVDNPDALPEITRIPVLMYHFFCNYAEDLECRDSNWLERDHFEEHMRYLYDNDFTSLKMIDLERFLNGYVRLPEQSVVLTFDDAHWSFFEHAYPILVEFEQLGTTFAITHHSRDWATLMLSENLEFHSHTHDMHRGHCDEGRGGLMQCIDFDDGVADLMMSRYLLNDTTVFCHPFGDFNDHTQAMLKEAGFTMAFTTQHGFVARGMDPLLLPRVRISTDTHLPQFRHWVNQ